MSYTESLIQFSIIQWFRNEFEYKNCAELFSIVNEGVRGNGARLIAQGLLPGVSDLVLLLKNGQAFFLEIKTETGKLSKQQVLFKKKCEKLNHNYIIIRSLEEFKYFIYEKII